MLISALEHGERLAVLQRDDGLLPARSDATGLGPGNRVAAHLDGADRDRGHPEALLERLADLRLGGVRMHLEDVLAAILPGGRALLGDQRLHHDPVQVGHQALSFLLRVRRLAGASTASASPPLNAVLSITIASACRISYAVASLNGSTLTPGTLRAERYTAGFAPAVSTSVRVSPSDSLSSSARRPLVLGASIVIGSITRTMPSRARALSAD